MAEDEAEKTHRQLVIQPMAAVRKAAAQRHVVGLSVRADAVVGEANAVRPPAHLLVDGGGQPVGGEIAGAGLVVVGDAHVGAC